MLKNPFKRYPCIKQHDITDCGAACLATISKHYGLKIPITKIREVAGTDRKGTNAYGVIKAAEQLGFTAKGVKGDKDAFFERVSSACNCPCYCGWNTDALCGYSREVEETGGNCRPGQGHCEDEPHLV